MNLDINGWWSGMFNKDAIQSVVAFLGIGFTIGLMIGASYGYWKADIPTVSSQNYQMGYGSALEEHGLATWTPWITGADINDIRQRSVG